MGFIAPGKYALHKVTVKPSVILYTLMSLFAHLYFLLCVYLLVIPMAATLISPIYFHRCYNFAHTVLSAQQVKVSCFDMTDCFCEISLVC